jgi:hypothetical protein
MKASDEKRTENGDASKSSRCFSLIKFSNLSSCMIKNLAVRDPFKKFSKVPRDGKVLSSYALIVNCIHPNFSCGGNLGIVSSSSEELNSTQGSLSPIPSPWVTSPYQRATPPAPFDPLTSNLPNSNNASTVKYDYFLRSNSNKS